MGGVTLHCGDALEVLRGLPAGAVDAVVTDPPFGVRSETWDDMTPTEFARFSMAWLSEARRVAPEMVVFCTQDSVIYDLCKLLYRRVRRMVWHKPEGSQYAGASECRVWFAYEVILHCHDRETWEVVAPKDAEVGRLIRAAREAAGLTRGAVDIAIRGKRTGLCHRWEEGACLPTPEQVARLQTVIGLNGEFAEAMGRASVERDRTVTAARAQASKHAARATDVFSHRTVTDGRHPCEKPVGLMCDILSALGQSWRTVLDPFVGSGTTGEACLKAGKEFIGCELDPTHYATALKRLRHADGAGSLFDPKQLTLTDG